jgi:uncharacterized repeat protein (TIGR02059 family)
MKKLLLVILTTGLVFSGCKKFDSTTTTTTGGPGRLSIKITDDPFDISSVESATVTISKIELRKAGTMDGDSFLVLKMNPVTVNIFELRNGITEELVNLEVPKGDYDLVRIYVDEGSLKIRNINEPFNLKFPSGKQTGIKVSIDPVIHVDGGISAELLLDFDLSKSFVMRGHNARNGFIFKPTIKAVNNSTQGRVEGVITDNSSQKLGLGNVTVSLLNAGKDTLTTLSDSTGHYLIIGVPEGTYSMSASKENYVAASVEGVVVVAGNKVAQNFILIALPVYVSSVIENAAPAILTMTYSLTLAGIVPDVSAFTVMVNSTARAVNTVTINGTKVQLTLASAVKYGDVVSVAYTKPGSNQLQTPEGGQAASITAQNVTNNVLAAIPVYVSAVIENATPTILTMTYSLTLANIIPDVSAFAVTVAGATRTVSSVTISDKLVKLTLSSAVKKGEAVTVAYTKPATNPLQTSEGGQAASLAAQPVTNNVN